MISALSPNVHLQRQIKSVGKRPLSHETDAFFHLSIEIGIIFRPNHPCWIGINDQIALFKKINVNLPTNRIQLQGKHQAGGKVSVMSITSVDRRDRSDEWQR